MLILANHWMLILANHWMLILANHLDVNKEQGSEVTPVLYPVFQGVSDHPRYLFYLRDHQIYHHSD